MYRSLRLVITAVLAAGLIMFGIAGPATAAPVKKGTSTVSSGLLTLAPILGIDVTATGPAEKVGDDFVMPVVGNPANGSLKHVGGIMLTKADGSTLSFESIHMDLETLEVSAVVNGMERVVIYQAEQVDADTVNLYFTPAGAKYVRDFVNFLGIPADGSLFGTSSTTAAIPVG